MPVTVYLADLRHNFTGVLSVDTAPLGVGFMKAVMDRELPASEVRSRVFAYPGKLLEALKENPPDVLMVSNYVWNEAASLYFLRLVKKLNPRSLAVMGGPNIAVEAERQVAYVASHPEIDLYVLGEGDFLAAEVLRHFLDVGLSVEKLGDRDIPSSVYRRDGELVRHETWPRRRSVDDIPSPYLAGIMDEFFDGKLAPMIETNRGCPFKCSYCVQGTDYYDKVNHFSLERMREEIAYIGRRNHELSPQMGTLRIADPNFGMYPRDVQISEFIAEQQRKYGWPTFIDATTGKNKPERIIECLEKVDGALVLYQAVQSLDDEVLRNIRRSNIKTEAYAKLMVHVRGRGLRSLSDLILGLPGESKESHLRGLFQLLDAGTHQAHCFQAMMLRGSDLESEAIRSKYDFLTKFRVLPKGYGVYDGERVFEIEEIIVGSDTLSFEDYVECRKHHFAFSVFWNDSWFADVLELVKSFGIRPSEWLQAMLAGMEEDEGPAGQLLDDFVAETKNELFDSREECAAFYAEDENFERLQRGEIGDNLMYKYRALASFFHWKEVCACAMRKTRELLLEHGAAERMPGFEAFWSDLHRFVEAKHASGHTVEEVTAPVRITVGYDIQKWLEDGSPHDLNSYRFPEPRTALFRLSRQGERELTAAFKVWSERLQGLTKLVVRVRVDSQVRTVAMSA